MTAYANYSPAPIALRCKDYLDIVKNFLESAYDKISRRVLGCATELIALFKHGHEATGEEWLSKPLWQLQADLIIYSRQSIEKALIALCEMGLLTRKHSDNWQNKTWRYKLDTQKLETYINQRLVNSDVRDVGTSIRDAETDIRDVTVDRQINYLYQLTPQISSSLSLEAGEKTKTPEEPEATEAFSTSLEQKSEISVEPKDPNQGKNSALRKFDSALGMNPAPRQKRDHWLTEVPPGPWIPNGRLLPEFTNWYAGHWQKKYSTADKPLAFVDALENVMAHFRKDPVNNIPDAWSIYHLFQTESMASALVSERSGVSVKDEVKEELLKHRIALTTPVPEEFAVTEYQAAPKVAEYAPDFAQRLEASAVQALPAGQQVIPLPEGVENVEAYRVFTPAKVQEESEQQISEEEFQSKLAEVQKMLNGNSIQRLGAKFLARSLSGVEVVNQGGKLVAVDVRGVNF